MKQLALIMLTLICIFAVIVSFDTEEPTKEITNTVSSQPIIIKQDVEEEEDPDSLSSITIGKLDIKYNPDEFAIIQDEDTKWHVVETNKSTSVLISYINVEDSDLILNSIKESQNTKITTKEDANATYIKKYGIRDVEMKTPVAFCDVGYINNSDKDKMVVFEFLYTNGVSPTKQTYDTIKSSLNVEDFLADYETLRTKLKESYESNGGLDYDEHVSHPTEGVFDSINEEDNILTLIGTNEKSLFSIPNDIEEATYVVTKITGLGVVTLIDDKKEVYYNFTILDDKDVAASIGKKFNVHKDYFIYVPIGMTISLEKV